MKVFIQNEAGSDLKNYHDEKRLEWKKVVRVSHPYPFPYGFIIGTTAADGCNVDCYVITQRTLHTGQIVECEPIGLMEQIEDGEADHNVLARLKDEASVITAEVEAALTKHVLTVFQHIPGKRIDVGRFLDADAAVRHIAEQRERVPTLITDRILLREWVSTDVEAMLRIYGNPEVMQFIGDGQPIGTIDVAAERLKLRMERCAAGFHYWAVVNRQSSEIIGTVILKPLPPTNEVIEIGWHLDRANWGHGYAAEAAQTVLHYAFTELRMNTVFAVIDPRNERSVRVADRIGLKCVGRTDKYYRKVLDLYEATSGRK